MAEAREQLSGNGLSAGMPDAEEYLIRALLDMGEALVGCGAEIYRAEDTLRRIGKAYGALSCEVFIITSSIVITLQMPGGSPMTQTRRIRRGVDNNFTRLENLNELSREICRSPIPPAELCEKIGRTSAQPVRRGLLLAGDVIAAAAFAVFFHGTVMDGIAAGVVGFFIWVLQVYMAPICMNPIVFEFLASVLSGILVCVLCRRFPSLQMNQIMIGDIMLLIPGIPFTNSIRDILLGDTLSGIVRFVEALVLALALTLGILSAVFLVGRV